MILDKQLANRKIKYVSREKILRDSWSIFQRVVRQFEYLENPGLSFELMHCLRTLHYYGHPVSTNNIITRKNYFITFFKVVVQFSLAGRIDPGNKVVSWGPWTKASITSFAISIPRCILAFNSPIIYAPYVFSGMFVCDICFLVSNILTFTLTHHRSFERIFFHLLYTKRKSIDIMIINVFLPTSKCDERELKC